MTRARFGVDDGPMLAPVPSATVAGWPKLGRLAGQRVVVVGGRGRAAWSVSAELLRPSWCTLPGVVETPLGGTRLVTLDCVGWVVLGGVSVRVAHVVASHRRLWVAAGEDEDVRELASSEVGYVCG